MKSRFDKLVIVRGAESRLATRDYSASATHLAVQESLAARLEGAASALSPETGAASGAGLAAQHELSGRMQTARRTTQARIDDAQIDRDEAALARKAARRALDAVVDIRRVHRQARIVRAEAKAVPSKPKGAGR
jgi:hypothetical protein